MIPLLAAGLATALLLPVAACTRPAPSETADGASGGTTIAGTLPAGETAETTQATEPIATAVTPRSPQATIQDTPASNEPASTSDTPVSSSAATPSTNEAPTEDYVGMRTSGGELGGVYQLVDLRIGVHDGFTRIVWQLDASGGVPLWEAVESTNSQEIASALGLVGSARIELTLHDVYAYSTAAALEQEAPASSLVIGTKVAPLMDDALLGFVIDLKRPARFEVKALEHETEPTRIVLDVYHE